MSPVPVSEDSRWLERYLPLFGGAGSHVLDVGCGPGLDAAALLGAGMEVTGFDRSVSQLRLARAAAPGAGLVRADVGRGFPFRDEVFDGAVASLSLHYLPWAGTLAAFGEVRRVMRPGAVFVFRVNATDDVNHGAGLGERLEENFYFVAGGRHGDRKRFFDEAAVREAVGGRFAIERLEHREIDRYELPKRVWECAARAV
jgi:SAM-dependent methyltransferase